MDQQLLDKVADTLLECVGIEGMAAALAELAETAATEEDEIMWLEAFAILAGDDQMPPSYKVEAESPLTGDNK